MVILSDVEVCWLLMIIITLCYFVFYFCDFSAENRGMTSHRLSNFSGEFWEKDGESIHLARTGVHAQETLFGVQEHFGVKSTRARDCRPCS